MTGRNIVGNIKAKAIIKHGVDVNFTDAEGNTPLILVSAHGDRDMAYVLLEHGANLDAKNHSGTTALMAAIKNEKAHEMIGSPDLHIELDSLLTTKLLIEKGADVSLTDRDGRTAHDFALHKPRFLKLLKKAAIHKSH